MRFFGLVLMSLVLGMGCATKSTLSELSEPFKPIVVISEDSDPVPDWLVPHVLKRTDQFCKESGRPGVKEVGIHYNAIKRHANVVYICLTDPIMIDEIAISDVPFRVTDEDLKQNGEISYLSSKAVYCLYLDPTFCGVHGVEDE